MIIFKKIIKVGDYIKKNYLLNGDCLTELEKIPSSSVDTIVTSPPYYGLRDYGIEGQLGLEDSVQVYIDKLVSIFKSCKRVLKDDGTLWLNLGDSYWSGKNRNGYEWNNNLGKGENYMLRTGGKNNFGLKQKDLMGMPWRIAFALQQDGWYLRSDIIWDKTNCMPEAVKDRPTKSHEYIFLLSKSKYYYYDFEAIKEDCINGDSSFPRGSKGVIGNKHKGNRKNEKNNENEINKSKILKKRNKRTVWRVATSHNKNIHFATFPGSLIEPCILAGCKSGGIVLDPFMGSGTVAKKAIELGRNYIGIEINPEYIKVINDKLSNVQIKFNI